MKKPTVAPLKPREKIKESGIYVSTKTRQRTTLDKNETASPTRKPGEKWVMEIPTDPKKR